MQCFFLADANRTCCLGFYAVLVLTLLFVLKKLMLWHGPYQESAVGIPPGSLGLPFVGETLQFMAAINTSNGFYDFVRIRRLRYGSCFKTSIFGQTHVFVSRTESAKAILNNESGNFSKRYIKSIAELVGDHSLLCASQHHHKQIRSSLINMFSTISLSALIKQFDQLILASIRSWENKGTIIVLHQALKITFKAMCKMLMSIENEQELEMLQADINYVCEAMLAFPLRFPCTRFYRGLKARKRIMSTLEMMMARRRSSDANQQDFLQHLLAGDKRSCPDGASKLSDEEIKDNILTMIIAGQDTTASAIAWMVKYIGENQNVLDTLCAEQFLIADKIASKRGFLTLEDINEMPYASKVVKESLRMASIVPWFPRLALENCELEGFKIKKGWNVNIDARSIHLDPILYEEPNNFNPSRFDDDSRPYSFLAFGMGGRTCLGMNMAKAMMLVFLHRLVTTYKWKVIDSDPSIEKWALFSRLKTGCPIYVTPI